MKLLVNTASTLKGGTVQIAYSFLEECKAHPEHEYHVVLSQTVRSLIKEDSYPANFTFYHIPYRPATKVFTLSGSAGYFKQLEAKLKPDVVFTTFGPAYWRPKAPHVMGFALGYFIYSELPFMQELSTQKQIKMRLKGALLRYFYEREADEYIVETDDVNLRLRKWIHKRPEQVHTVTNTYGAQYAAYSGHEKPMLAARKPGEKRFLMLSAWYFHKNFGILNPLAAELERRGLNHIRIVLTLPPDIFAEKFSEQAKKYLINHGPVPPAQAPGLYAECDFTFTPTLVECFTATYPEAMIMRKPVITSDLPFAHTICRDAALYFNPKNAASIADTIEKLTGSSELQAQLINNGIKQLEQFTDPPARAAAYLRICQNMIK